MSILTTEEGKVLTDSGLLEKFVIAFIKQQKHNSDFFEKKTSKRIVNNRIKIMVDLLNFHNELMLTYLGYNIINEHWRLKIILCKECKRYIKGAPMDYKKEIENIDADLENMMSLFCSRGITLCNIELLKSLGELYRILNKIYFLLYPEEIEKAKFDPNL